LANSAIMSRHYLLFEVGPQNTSPRGRGVPGQKPERTKLLTLWFETALLADGWPRACAITSRTRDPAPSSRPSPPRPRTNRTASAFLVCATSTATPPARHGRPHRISRDPTPTTSGPGGSGCTVPRPLTPDDVEAITARPSPRCSSLASPGSANSIICTTTSAGRLRQSRRDGGKDRRRRRPDRDRLTLLPVFYAHGGFGGAPPIDGQATLRHRSRAFEKLVEASAAAIASLPGANLGIRPHSLRR